MNLDKTKVTTEGIEMEVDENELEKVNEHYS